MESKDLLIEQYRIVEKRRGYFGRLFWQLPGFFIAVFAVFVGLADKGYPNLLSVVYFIGGTIFLLIAWIAYRLRVSQDECERILEDIETKLREAGIESGISLPRSKKYGARTATVTALVFSGLALLFTSIFRNWL